MDRIEKKEQIANRCAEAIGEIDKILAGSPDAVQTALTDIGVLKRIRRELEGMIETLKRDTDFFPYYPRCLADQCSYEDEFSIRLLEVAYGYDKIRTKWK